MTRPCAVPVAPSPDTAPLPDGFRVVLDPATRWVGDGTVLVKQIRLHTDVTADN